MKNNWNQDDAKNDCSIPLGVAIANDDLIQIKRHNERNEPFSCLLLDVNFQILENHPVNHITRSFELSPSPQNVPSISNIEIWSEERCIEKFFVHHESQILEQSVNRDTT